MECSHCHEPFEKSTPTRKYCSDTCKNLAYNESRRKPKVTVNCRQCGDPFETTETSGQVYCSRLCKALYDSGTKILGAERACKVCGNKFTVDQTHKAFCSDECRERHERGLILTPDEQVKQRDLANIEKRVRDDVGRTKILADLLSESVARVDAEKIKPYRPTSKPKRDPETMVVLVSDLHPGLLTPSYNLDVFHRRMELFIEKVVLIKDIISQTIPLERVVLVGLGDLVSGQGIFPGQPWKSQVHVLEQIYHHASPEVLRLLLTLCEHFPQVEAHFVPGNHGRTGKDNPLEANWDNVLAQDIERRFEFVDQVDVKIEWDWYKFVDVYDWRFLAVHGNQVRSWLGIPFYGLVTKGMKWQGSIPDGPWHYLLHGHFHVPFSMPWNNFEIISNGTLVSGDDFALRELGMASAPAQQVFGVHPEHKVTWRYTLDLA